jgi:hypothetical protein
MKKRKTKRNHGLYGLHLWSVTADELSYSLWITTRRKNIADAIKKATNFLKKSNLNCGSVDKAEYKGFIDA